MLSGDNYIFHWPHVDASSSYFYRLRIKDASTGQTVYKSSRSHNNTAYVPSDYLIDSSTNAYQFRIDTCDSDQFELIFNQSKSDYVPFTANQGNVEGLLSSSLVYNRLQADGLQYIVISTGIPDDIGEITLAEVTGPGEYRYQFNLAADYASFDKSLTHKFLSSNLAAPTQTGIYTFHISSNGDDYYSSSTLTPAVQYPIPDNTSWQVVNLGNGNIGFSWADVNYNGLLFYRVMILNENDEYFITSRENRVSATVNLQEVVDILGSGPLKWRVEVHDSTAWNTLRNRTNGETIPLVIPDYNSQKPELFGRIDNRNQSNGVQYIRSWIDAGDTEFSQISELNLSGPNGYEKDIFHEGAKCLGLGYQGITLDELESAPQGLYTYNLTTDTGSAIYFDTLTAPVELPVVDHRSLNVDLTATGNLILSWAPVYHTSPLWYNILIRTLADPNQDTFPDEVFNSYSQEQPHVEIPSGSLSAEPLFITIQARDGSVGETENNRSNSTFIGYEGSGFDYSSLVDADNDNWANNIDSDDNDPNVHPFAALDELVPPGLSLVVQGDSVTATWSPVNVATGYKLFYAPFPYTGPDTIGVIDLGNQTSFSAELWNGASFYIAITAYNDEGESEFSNVEWFIINMTDVGNIFQ